MNTKRIEKLVQSVRNKYGIHGRKFTAKDFYAVCEGEGIRLIGRNVPDAEKVSRRSAIRGCLLRGKGWLTIYLACFWEKKFDLFTAYHELGHYFCRHKGMLQLNAIYKDDYAAMEKAYKELPDEAEADLFSELCTGRKRREVR